MAIQKLKASGAPKAETIKQILEKYPDLCKGPGEEGGAGDICIQHC